MRKEGLEGGGSGPYHWHFGITNDNFLLGICHIMYKMA